MSDLVDRLRDKWRHSEEDCYEAADEIERLREALKNSYSDYIDALNKIKTDVMTQAAVHHRIVLSETLTAKDFMIAIADDIEREVNVRAALATGGERE